MKLARLNNRSSALAVLLLWRRPRSARTDDPGDTSMVTLAEVERVMHGGGARVKR